MAWPTERDKVALLIGAPIAQIDNVVHIEADGELATCLTAPIPLSDMLGLLAPVGRVFPSCQSGVAKHAAPKGAQNSEVPASVLLICQQPVQPSRTCLLKLVLLILRVSSGHSYA